ncbi:MAG: N-acetylglucosamine-6-phosphate deacetylase [Christensenellales bacterium]|jgi:N-acetylglucosamine-6-phosphate deacetylase
MLIKNATVISNRRKLEGYNILIQGNIIKAVTAEECDDAEVIDCSGLYATAGYIDIHTHGGYLHDVMEATEESLGEISKFHLDTGATTYLPTTLTASEESIVAAIDNVRAYKEVNEYSRIYGIHLEGPFFTPFNAGAQPPQFLIAPNKKNTAYIFRNADIIKRISIAPDVEGIIPFVKELTDAGIQVSGGHDNAVDFEINPCIDNGMSSVTHIFNCTSNASRRPLHKYLGLTEIGLIDDRLYAEVIGDNRHTPFPEFNIIYKLKGADKILLVSDSLSVAGMGNIRHYLGKRGEGYEIEVRDEVAILPELNTYAGSVTPVAKMVQILLRDYSVPIEEAVCMANLNQAELLKISDRGDIREGMLADINIIDGEGNIVKTVFNGKIRV